jgi:tRNA threonylcarbamoyl adenosine modification protein YeaZ
MTILGLEFSSPLRSVALNRHGEIAEATEAGGRHTAALGMVDKVLAQAAATREETDTLVIGLGPGSYTGIRAAIALAQGWQLACGVKLLGLSSVEAIIARARQEEITGRVSVVIDAQRQEFYLATYDLTTAGYAEIEPLQIVTLAEAQLRAASQMIIGPEVTRWFPEGRLVFPTAASLTHLALVRSETHFISGEQLEPIYLRETAFVKAPPSRVVNGI